MSMALHISLYNRDYSIVTLQRRIQMGAESATVLSLASEETKRMGREREEDRKREREKEKSLKVGKCFTKIFDMSNHSSLLLINKTNKKQQKMSLKLITIPFKCLNFLIQPPPLSIGFSGLLLILLP